jgi:hypothetical protein
MRESELNEFALLAGWLYEHPESQNAPDGISRSVFPGKGNQPDVALYAVYDEIAAAHDVLDSASIGPEHPDYQRLRGEIAGIIRMELPGVPEINARRGELLGKMSISASTPQK